MAKKVTVRDVAAAAGVSVATVSYVLNEKKDAKISETTRKKVLQVANLLNYMPHQETLGLPAGGTHTIGITYRLCQDTPSRNIEIMQLLNLLVERFGRLNYNCLILSSDPDAAKQPPIRGLDGIIAIDLEEKEFKDMAGDYYIPILCLDMLINDFLFYQIYTDMDTLTLRAREQLGDDFYLVMDRPCNRRYQNYISGLLPDGHLLLFSECKEEDFLALKKQKILVMGTYLGLALRQLIPEENLMVLSPDHSPEFPGSTLPVLHYEIEKKANLAVNIMLNALEKKFDVKHEYKIS